MPSRSAHATPSIAVRSERRLAWLVGVALMLLAAWNARRVLGFDLLSWDDDYNLTFNTHLGPVSWARLRWMFTDLDHTRRYLPLGWLGFSLVHTQAGIAPFGYHLASLVFHSLNTGLLFLAIRRMLARWAPVPDGRWPIACAALGAAVWALHPLRAETTGWASSLLYAWSGAFCLLALNARLSAAGVGRGRTGWTIFFYLCAVLTYPVALGFAIVLLLVDWADERRGDETRRDAGDRFGARVCRVILRGRWLLVAAGAALAITLVARFTANDLWMESEVSGTASVSVRLARAVCALAEFPMRFIAPVGLTPAPAGLLDSAALGGRLSASALLLVIVSALLALRPAGRRGPLLFWLGYLALLVPVTGLTDTFYFPADRYLYLPDMVLGGALALGLAGLAPPRRWLTAVVAIAAVVLGMAQRSQLEIWQNNDSLYRRIVDRAADDDYRVFIYRRWVTQHASRGELAQARQVADEAAAKLPAWPGSAVAKVLIRYADAADGAMRAGRVEILADRHEAAARELARAGQYRDAVDHFTAALRLAPRLSTARYNFGVTSALVGDGPRALHQYLALEASADLSPGQLSNLRELLARAYEDQGQGHLASKLRRRG